jgi:predicted aspartyl protease
VATHRSPRRDPHDLQNFGPRLAIEVALPILRSTGTSVSTAQPQGLRSSTVPALIDTGAGRTVLTPEAVRKVGLPLVDRTTLSRAGGRDEKVGVHVASLRFSNSALATIEVIQVLCCDLPDQPVHCLIGRDILARWLFTYDGRVGAWRIDEESKQAWVEPPEEGLWK